MAGKVKNLLNRDGRYFSRLVIPKEIRPFLDNKTELREPFGPDRRTALAQRLSVSALPTAGHGYSRRAASSH